MLSAKSKSWLIAISYVTLIYLTLDIVRTPLSFLREQGLLRITLYFLYGLITTGLFWHLINNSRSPVRLSAFVIAIGLYAYFSRATKSPEEQVHFIEYGLAGVLFARALKFHFEKEMVINLGALSLASLAGWIDEILQGLSATRHYDNRDVVLNVISATLGLFVYKVLFYKSH